MLTSARVVDPTSFSPNLAAGARDVPSVRLDRNESGSICSRWVALMADSVIRAAVHASSAGVFFALFGAFVGFHKAMQPSVWSYNVTSDVLVAGVLGFTWLILAVVFEFFGPMCALDGSTPGMPTPLVIHGGRRLGGSTE